MCEPESLNLVNYALEAFGCSAYLGDPLSFKFTMVTFEMPNFYENMS